MSVYHCNILDFPITNVGDDRWVRVIDLINFFIIVIVYLQSPLPHV